MKTVKLEEPITRSRFVNCPHCKTRGLRLKRIVQVGRCRTCHESYKVIIQFVKRRGEKQRSHPQSFESGKTSPESTLPSWHVPTDSSLFGPVEQMEDTSSGFVDRPFGWGRDTHGDGSRSGSGE